MSAVIFMIRGVNVSGQRPLKMEVLRRLCEGLGLANVRTYLNSGNAVGESAGRDVAGLGAALQKAIAAECGFEADVAARTAKAMDAVVAANPLAGGPSIDPRFLHATFVIRGPAKLELDEAALPRAQGERAVLVRDTLYLYCPAGYGNSKINNGYFEKKLAIRATTRNWNTVNALARMGRGELP